MRESDLTYWARRAEEEDARAQTEDIALRAFHRKCAELYRKRIEAHAGAAPDIFEKLTRPTKSQPLPASPLPAHAPVR